MRIKFKSILIICIIFLSTLILGLDFHLEAKSQYEENTHTSDSRSNNHPRDGDFDWGEIGVISEPILNQNNNINYSSESSIAVEDDKIYVVWRDDTDYNGSGGDYDIFYRYFDGNKWTEIQVISEPVKGQNINTEKSSVPDIAVENGNIYIVWQDTNDSNGSGGDYDIFYRCNLTGSRWEDIQVISEPVHGQNLNTEISIAPKITIENNKIYVVWEDGTNLNGAGVDRDIFYRCNLTGVNWESIQTISEPLKGKNFNIEVSGGPKITVENGRIYVVWTDKNNTNNVSSMSHNSDIFLRCNLTRSFWEPIQVISEPIFGKDYNIDSGSSSIEVENNKIYVVWSSMNNTYNSGIDWDIFYRCNLTGFGWEDIQVISEPGQNVNFNIGDSLLPVIGVENGRIYVVWYDYNNTNGAGIDTEIFYKCNFTGFSWEPVQVISEPIEGKDFNTGLSITPDLEVYLGKSHIVWRDRNDTNDAGSDDDIVYRRIKDPSPLFLNQPNVSPKSGNTSTNFNFTITYFHYDNTFPAEITVNISGIEYSMLEIDPVDINYIDGKDYFFNIKNLEIGIRNYQFYTSDSKFTWSTRIVNQPKVYNTPPNITTEDNLTAFEDAYYEVDYISEDIDIVNVGQSTFWNFSTNASWLRFNTITSILNGTPTNEDVGEYWVNVSINDTMDIDFTNFTLNVINVNDAPIIITDDIEIINEDEIYEIEYVVNDVDSPQDSLFWNMQTNATWLDFENTTAKLSGTPENDDVGEYWVNISVNDAEDNDYSNFTLKVINVNDPPRIITKDNTTAFEDEFYEMNYKAEDVDNILFELFWDINTNAKWLNYDIPTAIINGTPTNDDIGEYWVNTSVNDGEYTDHTNFTLIVVNTNDPPMITTEDKTEVTVGELFSINYEAEDIDPPPITLTWSVKSNSSDWLTIDTYNGWLNGIPSENDIGIYWVNISVTDGEDGWDFHNFTLQVSKTPFEKNHPPKLSNASITPLEGNTKTEFTFSVHYYDEDGDMPGFIQVVIEDTAYNIKLKSGENASNGTYEYSVTLPEGTHNYYFITSDGFETVKTDNSTTPEIKSVKGISQERTSWYWLIWIIIIVIIITSLMFLILFRKRKIAEIPTVKAELIHAPPVHTALPSMTPSEKGEGPLPPQVIVSEQLLSPKVQIQSTAEIPSEKVTVPTLLPVPLQSQFQLPQATLSKVQKLELLEERFLRGEVDLENFKKLKAKIEAHTGKEITKNELEEKTAISERQEPEAVESSNIDEASPTNKLEVVDKPQQHLQIESGLVVQQQPSPELHRSTEVQSETSKELSTSPEINTPQPQTPEQQPSPQVQLQAIPIVKEQADEK